ncbi:TMEM147 family protein [Megaselia abdita]
MLVLATFFDSLSSPFVSDVLKAVVDVADLFGMALILSRIPGKDHNKLITTGFGWAISEVVITRLLTLWIGARGAEFSWIYIQKCLESNILLVQHISTATLVWLFTRNNLNKAIKPFVIFLLAATVLKSLWLDSTLIALNMGPWLTLAFKALCTVFNGFLTLNVYSKVNV